MAGWCCWAKARSRPRRVKGVPEQQLTGNGVGEPDAFAGQVVHEKWIAGDDARWFGMCPWPTQTNNQRSGTSQRGFTACRWLRRHPYEVPTAQSEGTNSPIEQDRWDGEVGHNSIGWLVVINGEGVLTRRGRRTTKPVIYSFSLFRRPY